MMMMMIMNEYVVILQFYANETLLIMLICSEFPVAVQILSRA